MDDSTIIKFCEVKNDSRPYILELLTFEHLIKKNDLEQPGGYDFKVKGQDIIYEVKTNYTNLDLEDLSGSRNWIKEFYLVTDKRIPENKPQIVENIFEFSESFETVLGDFFIYQVKLWKLPKFLAARRESLK